MVEILGCACELFFFFKQKTAYEMRISDWSSDVCSSDLKLTSRGFAVRYSHLKDKRMLGLELTPEGKGAMEDMLRELVRLLGEAGYRREMIPQIGRASCRESVGQYV